VAPEDPDVRARLVELDRLYAKTPKKREPHPDIGCWWTLYDYGLDVVKTWSKDYKHPYPGLQIDNFMTEVARHSVCWAQDQRVFPGEAAPKFSIKDIDA
jgi:hypothetical protein